MPAASRLDEFSRIRRYLAPLAEAVPGAWNLTDDAAWIETAGQAGWVVAADAIVAGVHFLPDDSPGDVARRLLRVNLSDMAAMGAQPKLYLLTLALPPSYGDDWFAAFAEGLRADQDQFGLGLAGGDCVATDGSAVFSVTMIGHPSAPVPLRRAGARPGDILAVSGQLGDAALGLRIRQGSLEVPADDAALFESRRRYPEPRVGLGLALADLAHAAIDISDGLVADLHHLCEASGIGAELQAGEVPLSSAARRALARYPDLLEIILTGGDDYELLLAFSPRDWRAVKHRAVQAGVPLTRIGVFQPGGKIVVFDSAGREMKLPRRGYRHV